MIVNRSRRAYLFNCSPKYYSRGLTALSYWLKERGYQVQIIAHEPTLFDLDADLFAFSAIFTWHLPRLVEWVNRVKDFGQVWVGGPAPSVMPPYVVTQTGITPVVGPDPRFERQPGPYRMTRTSRGCPNGCPFCIVPRIDGATVVEYTDFPPAPIVMDDNVLACSVEHQEGVVERLRAEEYEAIDFNQGFEAARFSWETFERFRQLPIRPWRLAFDTLHEELHVRNAIRILREHHVPSNQIRVYVLVGNEPFEHCHYRAEKVIEWGGEPYVQPLVPLNALEKKPVVQHRYGWTAQLLVDFQRYYNRWLWRKPGRGFEWYDTHARRKRTIQSLQPAPLLEYEEALG